MSSSSSPREIIQISLGPSANAITAHLLNLQGLAATSSSSVNNAYCDPNTTHYIHDETLVPRILMIDEAHHRVPVPTTTAVGEGGGMSHYDSSTFTDTCWDGQIQVLGDDPHHRRDDISVNPFLKTASALAYSPHSRYHCSSSLSTGHRYRADPENSRHVVWDDNEEEIEEEDPYERTKRKEHSERRWRTETVVQLGQDLDRQVAGQFQVQKETKLSTSTPPQGFHFNHWTDIWMPPRDEKSKVVLPFSSQSKLVPHWNVSYQNTGRDGINSSIPFLDEWKQDTLFERLRHQLEACDCGIQGVSIATEGHGIYASLSTYLLEELQQECKSAGRLVYHITDDMSSNSTTNAKESSLTETGVSASNLSSTLSWQEAQVDRIRKNVSSGLALYDFTEKAHAVLPLRLSGDIDGTSSTSTPPSSLPWFRATAQIALALESCTLPFRFNGKTTFCGDSLSDYRMGLQNAPFLAQGGSDTSWGSTATRLSFSEYLHVLQPSSSHSMLELDVLSQKSGGKMVTNQKLYDSIRAGTSVERDQRTRQSGGSNYRSRPQESPIGSWMQDSHLDSTGLLSSLSYSNAHKNFDANLNRLKHHHFALSTSVRPILLPAPPTNDYDGITMSNYLTCLVQSMGIQYRPERSMATVLNQSLGQMTCENGGDNYGAGSYWKYIIPEVDAPVVAVVGNTTRAYCSLNEIAMDMQKSMLSSRCRGYYNRDISNAVLPEVEDCEEALEACLSKRDVYHPPQGSGLVVEEEDENY
mmetsp:Transcript_19090/g.22099  ORF Transcript_19090/g.22099 Transcript_19090/m.22099 type:complete len:754 (+) Transcript_19090:111-2372(+)|eukprot:CAMPEP_0170768648 /NCGR_PEP_ID=MMETSP0733-20121128/6531_1 /TAXON_ID=186038 /ORGANISM="Fragilariopsis kerguelensis, Strain L26-C5" /LENGTH=753 /DNA_ID=CAMNT_0011110141 /DNA_START=28 /DNA_END=2289 /DNA_ORIENTATION=-